MNRRPPRKFGLNPIERAVIMKNWRKDAISAQIMAMEFDDAAAIIHNAGRIIYVTLRAWEIEGFDTDIEAFEIISKAANAAFEQDSNAPVTPENRSTIIAGLQVIDKVYPSFSQKSITDAVMELEVKLVQPGYVDWNDFKKLMKEAA